MASYLFVDVENLLARLRQRGISIDLYEMASGLRGGAALAAGLASPRDLVAVAIANWEQYQTGYGGVVNVRQVFESCGFELCHVADRRDIEFILRTDYLDKDPVIGELIIATNDPAILSILDGLRLAPSARVRIWGELSVTLSAPSNTIFQPLETILGFQGSLVALYIDFENIAISLDKQGYTVNLEHLIARIIRQAQAHGQVIHMAAYAPWGQRGSLPPLVDNMGREISDEAPTRLALANIDPIFNLPGKNSADMRIARDVLADLMHPEGADVFILASGDRDFNEIINTLRAHNKQVIVWGVRGSVSRQVETNPGVLIEYIEDFTTMQPHEALGRLYTVAFPVAETASVEVSPSQWVSAILQYDRLHNGDDCIPRDLLERQLVAVNAVVSQERASDLITQALAMGLFRPCPHDDNALTINPTHPLVGQTRLVRDRIVARVANTLDVRNWEYVNYGFLLKGIAMDRELDRPGLNMNDQWRSEWIDCLVREGILQRELVPHRHNPDDLVPVIRLSSSTLHRLERTDGAEGTQRHEDLFGVVAESDLEAMQRRIVVSIEQFTSFRGFQWCPLGSLHRRLRPRDPGMVFQRAIESLLEQGAVAIQEYDNPQSEFKTKGISLTRTAPLVTTILAERDLFVRALLSLYDRHEAIAQTTQTTETGMNEETLTLWLSIMEDENVINPVPGRSGQYSLFRTHHTVMSVAEQST